MGYDPMTHRPRTDLFASLPNIIALANLLQHHPLEDHAVRLQVEAAQLAKIQYLQLLFQSSNNYNPTSSNTTQYYNNNNNIGDLGGFNLTNFVKENSTPSLNLSNLENQTFFSNENNSGSQLLHNPDNTQVPFNFQTHLNNSINDISDDINCHNFNFDQENNSPSSPLINTNILNSPNSSSHLPPLTEISISNNQGDSSSNSTNNAADQGASSYWPELLFEEHFMHDIS